MRGKKITAVLLAALMTFGCLFNTADVFATSSSDGDVVINTTDDDGIDIDNDSYNVAVPNGNTEDDDIVINGSADDDVSVSLDSDGELSSVSDNVQVYQADDAVNDDDRIATYAAKPSVSKTGIVSVNGYSYLINYADIKVANCTVTSSNGKWHKKNMGGEHQPTSLHHAIYYDGTVSGSGRLPGTVTLKWANAAEDGAGVKYDLVVTVDDIRYHAAGSGSATNPIIIADLYSDEMVLMAWFGASAESRTCGRFGIRQSATYKLVQHGTNSAVAGNMLLAWSDLDQPGINATYDGGQANYVESIRIGNGLASALYVEPDTCLKVSDDNHEFCATRGTTGFEQEKRSGVALIGNAQGTTVTWAGSNCWTKFVTDIGGKFVKYNQTVRIRHQQKDGSWTGWTTVIDKKKIAKGMSFWYQWTRGNNEPANVYNDPSPSIVGTNSVSGDATYDISVPRKQYTYSFDVNPPVGHNAGEVGNKQSNITKYAENMPGGVKSPTLTGYTFLGWSSNKKDIDYNSNESMLSNRTFYALWRANKYYVHYEPNGGSNPNQQEGEFTQNTVTGTMSDSQYTYDVRGSLRANAFAREGYEFIGWNTKADGTGVAYPNSSYNVNGNCYGDGYDNVYNWTSEDNKVLNLYAQWRKKLGTETVTVVSEETGAPLSNVHLKLYKNVNGTKTLVSEVGEKVTNNNGKVTVNNLHWFDYTWEVVGVPTGYSIYPYDASTMKLTSNPSQTSFKITYNQLSAENEIVLWIKRVGITLDSQVQDIIPGESAPSFMYTVTGRDVAGISHTYHVMVDVSGSSKKGSNGLENLLAGTYTVTQTPVSRYIPQTAKNVSNSSISGINGTADVLNHDSAEILFPYNIKQYGGFGSMMHRVNEINSTWRQ